MTPAQKGKWFQCFKYVQINHVQEGRGCISRKQGRKQQHISVNLWEL